MDVATSLPGVQFYTGNKLAGVTERSSGPEGLPKHAALCLETQHFPDAPNQPDFPSAVLHPGEEFRHTTVYAFSYASSVE
jgi:aldose 1-epimerase